VWVKDEDMDLKILTGSKAEWSQSSCGIRPAHHPSMLYKIDPITFKGMIEKGHSSAFGL
jgi:hypothetical protein